jgi:hypothetical protein
MTFKVEFFTRPLLIASKIERNLEEKTRKGFEKWSWWAR